MQTYSVSIKQRDDGLVVARIPSLSQAIGYGLDQEEALFELFKALRRGFRKGAQTERTFRGSAPTMSPCQA
jgi:hypothetical protein